jgi:NADPH-dependent ferric siderophore reductase
MPCQQRFDLALNPQMRLAWLQSHEPPLRCRIADRKAKIGTRQTFGQRLSQGASWYTKPIAKSKGGIDDHDRKIFAHSGILKTIIHQNHIWILCQSKRQTLHSFAGHDHRAKGGNQQRFIAHLGRPMSLWIHQSRHGDTTAIATRQGHDLPASLL